MDESAIKGQKSLELKGEKRTSTISVEGYDTRVHQYPLMLALRKQFASCGKIARIAVPRDFKKGILKSPLFISFWGEGARDRALKLSGSDLRGWTLVVKPVPQQKETAGSNNHLFNRDVRSLIVKVDDLPSSVRNLDFKIGLCEYFSSCGEVASVTIFHTADLADRILARERGALVSIMGKGCVEKALELSERNAKGWNIIVEHVVPPNDRKRKRTTGCENPFILMEKIEKAAKMEKGKKKKKTTE